MCKNEKLMGKIGLLVGIDNARFKRQVTPGDQLLLEFEVNRMKGEIVKGKGIATVNSELVCEAEISLHLCKKEVQNEKDAVCTTN